jgi:hypothetical protein
MVWQRDVGARRFNERAMKGEMVVRTVVLRVLWFLICVVCGAVGSRSRARSR